MKCTDPDCPFEAMAGYDVCCLHPKSGALDLKLTRHVLGAFYADDYYRNLETYTKEADEIVAEAKAEECRELLRDHCGFVVLRCQTTADRLALDLLRSLRYLPCLPANWHLGRVWHGWRDMFGSVKDD